jgi:pimeloyl-ACP methyl ester carboxylesterase
MKFTRRRLVVLVPFVIGVALIATAYRPIADLSLSLRLLGGIRRLAAGDAGRGYPARETTVTRTRGSEESKAVLYLPRDRQATRGLVFVPGISELGIYHPRLISLCRVLASCGFAVLTPDIEALREFQIAPAAIDQVSFWFGQMRALPETAQIRKVGLAGVSFSGTVALIAASRAEIRDSVAFVLGIGPYYDIVGCARDWFAAGPVTVSEGYYPTRYYARWVIMLAALDLIESETDREYMDRELRSLLLQQQMPPPPQGLTMQGMRWHRMALAREDESDPEQAGEIIAHLVDRVAPSLSPAGAAREVRCPVFLAHGTYDDLIPIRESVRLKSEITRARSHLLLSPFLTHTHPASGGLSSWQTAQAAGDALVFLYALARATRP